MMESNEPITELDLHAYIDGQLSAQRRAEVAAYIAVHPDAAERVAEYQKQNALLHRFFDPVMQEPLPERIFPGRRKKESRRLFYAASMAASLLFGLTTGWYLHGTQTFIAPAQGNLFQQAYLAHAVYTPEVRHPVEVAASEQSHMVGWLSKRLGVPLHVPQLDPEGFRLMGGRLLPGDRGPAAQFMYENAQGRRLTLYIRGAHESISAFRFGKKGEFGTLAWVDSGLAYALTADMQRDQLMPLAHRVYEELEKDMPH